MKRIWPAPERNKEPILEVLRRVLPSKGTVLELASGSGQHAVHFAAALPRLRWQPTDLDPENLASIEAWRAEAGLPNLLAPIRLDATGSSWPVDAADALVASNLVHIAPWEVTEALFRGARRLLPRGAPLVLYGPYKVGGAHTAPSNAAFDEDLRRRDPAWGVRDVDDVRQQAGRLGFQLEETVPMPANNLTLVFRRS